MCNTHLTSTFLLNDSMEGEKEQSGEKLRSETVYKHREKHPRG